MSMRRPSLARPEMPIGVEQTELAWGSDVVAAVLHELGVDYLALTPGASYRGLHDSVVNYLGNERPQMLLCLHEEHAVAIAHGYAKVTERPMAVALHSNVGLMHATMSIFNAFCDRVPMLVLGATGPVDAAARRPWIDWLHTAADQAALVRPFVKWDDQPASVAAAVESVPRAAMLSSTRPCAPVYVCLDVALQEEQLTSAPRLPAARRFRPASPPHADPALVERVADLLHRSRDPVLLVGRVSRDATAWSKRVELAERIGGRVFTHLRLPAAFPTDHPLHAAPPSTFPSDALRAALRDADIVLSLDWLDLGGALAQAAAGGTIDGTIISVSLDQQLHFGWSKDHMAPIPADERLLADPDAFVHQLLLSGFPARRGRSSACLPPSSPPVERGAGGLGLADLASALRSAAGDQPVSLLRVPSSWSGSLWDFRSPLDYLGGDGGEGVGSGPGMAIGAALGLVGSDRLPVAVLGDGDFLMGVNALWTAAHYRVPLLVVVANNRSFFNDELHQQYIAEQRGRPTTNRWIGQRIDDPPPDLAMLARAQGLVGYGPIDERPRLAQTLADAIAEVRAGAAVVVDVLTDSDAAGTGVVFGRRQ
jgi:thiamine pyrophosphate-dependent acetolactate synthase large subunit-like protein